MSNQCLCRLCQMSFKSFVYSDNKLFIQIGIKIKSCECSIYIIKLDNEVTSSGFIGKREIKKNNLETWFWKQLKLAECGVKMFWITWNLV